MRYYIVCLFISTLLACNQKSNEKVVEPPAYPSVSDSLYVYANRAINNGDSIAYRRASYLSFIKDKSEDFFYVAFIVANKYGYRDAYFDVYRILRSGPNYGNVNQLDSASRRLAIFYLLKSLEKGYSDAILEVKTVFKDSNSIPLSTQYLERSSSGYR